MLGLFLKCSASPEEIAVYFWLLKNVSKERISHTSCKVELIAYKPSKVSVYRCIPL